ncbi:FeoC-like transcriptional regulator [bacterium]|nr:FeoC-like transcriptional regulator [bacterium]MCB2179396.1 FeoC-like transcriptional regulator [bacterium]
MLSELLKLIETHHGDLSQDELCTELGISADTLQNLLDILVRKGRITLDKHGITACKADETCFSTGKICPGPEHCQLILLAPKQFTIKIATGEEE